MAAVLPYLCVFARSLGRAQTQPADETVAGILAGVGCALKPQFLVAFALLEIVGRTFGLRLLRRMTISAALTVFVYIAALLVLFPTYFTSAIPLGLALTEPATSVGCNCSATLGQCCSLTWLP